MVGMTPRNGYGPDLIHQCEELDPGGMLLLRHWRGPLVPIEVLHGQLHLYLQRLPPATGVVQLSYPGQEASAHGFIKGGWVCQFKVGNLLVPLKPFQEELLVET